MTDIDLTEAVEAAAISWDENRGLGRMRAAITAALPRIERQVREQVAREIKAAHTDVVLDHGGDATDAYVGGILFGLDRAERIARGEQP